MSFQLLHPIKPLHINQMFGNPDPKYFPLGLKGHNGIDFAAYRGQPVYAAHDGFAVYQTDTYGGHGVVIQSSPDFSYETEGASVPCRFVSIYWHFIDYPLVNGQTVRAGDCIGFADSTGFSTGDHLHFGLKVQTPEGTNIEQENGFLGAIDPKPYFVPTFAEDVPKSISQKLFILGHQYNALDKTTQGRIVLAVSRLVEAWGN